MSQIDWEAAVRDIFFPMIRTYIDELCQHGGISGDLRLKDRRFWMRLTARTRDGMPGLLLRSNLYVSMYQMSCMLEHEGCPNIEVRSVLVPPWHIRNPRRNPYIMLWRR